MCNKQLNINNLYEAINKLSWNYEQQNYWSYVRLLKQSPITVNGIDITIHLFKHEKHTFSYIYDDLFALVTELSRNDKESADYIRLHINIREYNDR